MADHARSVAGNQWFLLFSSTLSGIGGALWYVAEATIILTYPAIDQRGRAIAVWVAFRNGGSIIGGSLNLALNADASSAGSISLKTYLVFVALMCLGFPTAFLLSHPTKVRRSDGTRVGYNKTTHSLKKEAGMLWRVIKHKRVSSSRHLCPLTAVARSFPMSPSSLGRRSRAEHVGHDTDPTCFTEPYVVPLLVRELCLHSC